MMLLFSTNLNVLSIKNVELDDNEQAIINEIVEKYLNSGSSLSMLNVKIEPRIVKTNKGFGVQLEFYEVDGNKEIMTILPYKVDENGELVNSFDYANKQKKSNQITINQEYQPVPSYFVDVIVTVRTYWGEYFLHLHPFYRHAGIEAWWSSNNLTASISSMTVNYESAGILYKYPDVISDMDGSKIQDYFYIKSSIVKSNPVKDTVYIDGSNAMNYDRVLLCTDFFNHGGFLYVKITYTVNGTTRTHDDSYIVYGPQA